MKKKKRTEELKRRARVLAEEIVRLKLLQALRQKSTEEKRPVSVLRPVGDKIPSIFIK